MSRSKRQLNRHCIRCKSILKTKTRREKPLGRVKRTKLGDEAELVEREETKQKQPKTITAEAYLDALRIYIIDLARAGVEGRRNEPSAAETDGSQTYDHVQIPLEITVNSHARVSDSQPASRGLYCRFNAKDWTGDYSLCRTNKMSAVPHPHYLVDTSVTLVTTILCLNKWQDICCQQNIARPQLSEHHCRCS